MLDVKIFFLSLFLSYTGILFFKRVGGFGLYSVDNNKAGKPRQVLTSAGFVLALSILFSYLYLFWVIKSDIYLAIFLSLIIGLMVGMYDDFFETHLWYKVPQMSLASIPFIWLKPWDPMILGFDFGMYYWMLILPLVIMAFPNGFNIIAGYDGVEAGCALIMSFAYLLLGIILGNETIIYLTLPVISSLIVFTYFNWYPSQLFGGNSFSFSIGLIVVLIPMIEQFKIVLPFFFFVHGIEFLFKLKHKGKTNIFGKLDDKGIFYWDEEIKSVGHFISRNGNLNEIGISKKFLLFQLYSCIFGLFVWYFYMQFR